MNWHTVPMPENALVVMMGAPGSGKSTVVGTRFSPAQVLCLDTFRGIVAGDEGDQGATRDAVRLLHHALGYRVKRGLTTVIDATAAVRANRADLVRRSGGLTPVLLWVRSPVEECIRRQEARTRRVPEDVIRRIHADIEAVRPEDLREEGFKLLVIAQPMGWFGWRELGSGA